MIYLLAQSAMMTSVTKALLATLLLLGWAVWAPVVSKDAAYFHLKFRMWNAINAGSAAMAFLLLFLIPLFIIGFPFALAIIGGAGGAYVAVRNKAVPAKFKWKLDLDTFQKILSQKRQARAEKAATIRFKSAKTAPKDLKPVPLPDDDLYDTHLRVEEMLEAALLRHAQAIDISGGEGGFSLTLSVDGVEFKHSKPPSAEALADIDYFKSHCGLDLTDKRRLQTGKCNIETANHGNHELKVQTSGSTRGIECHISIDPLKQLNIPLNELGLLESQMNALRPVLEDTHGVIVVATPPQEGRTVTLYAFTSQHDPYTMDIHLVESEAEREWEAVTQHKIDPADQSKSLRTLFLRDPHIITIATVTDQPTAQQIAQAAAEGKRLYVGMRADDTFSALKLWVKAVGDRDLAAKTIRAVVSQRLVRRLCTFCRQKYKPDAAALKKLNLPADKIKELYKAGGKVVVKNEPEPCPACHGIGYQGRTAAYEVLVFDDEARKLLAAGQFDNLRTHIRRQKTQWLEEAALSKVVAGITSIAEAMRVMGNDHESGGRDSGGDEGGEPVRPRVPRPAKAATPRPTLTAPAAAKPQKSKG